MCFNILSYLEMSNLQKKNNIKTTTTTTMYLIVQKIQYVQHTHTTSMENIQKI